MYVSNLSQLVDVTDRQRREMDEQLGRLASIWTRRMHGRRRPARSGQMRSVSDALTSS
jgi:hypothetical protein